MKLAEKELPIKPKARGLIHLIMSPVSLVAGLVLITAADKFRGRITLGIFTLTAVTLFSCSAIYHRVNWQTKYKALWRRIDHANIPILIAGTYTPFAVFLLSRHQAIILLTLVWTGALLTAVMRISWLTAPRWLICTSLYCSRLGGTYLLASLLAERWRRSLSTNFSRRTFLHRRWNYLCNKETKTFH